MCNRPAGLFTTLLLLKLPSLGFSYLFSLDFMRSEFEQFITLDAFGNVKSLVLIGIFWDERDL